MAGRRRLAVLLLAVVLLLGGVVAVYVRRELADSEAFADRAVVALRSDAVRSAIAEKVALELVERQSPDLVATRPLVLVAVEAALDTESFARILRRGAVSAHELLFAGRGDVVVELDQLREVLLPALRSASPELARRVPKSFAAPVAEVRSSDVATRVVRSVDRARNVAWPLLGTSLALLVVLAVTAPERRRAVGVIGTAVAVAGAVAVLGLTLLETRIVARAGSAGLFPEQQAKAAVRAVWDALAGDLLRAFLILIAAGLLLRLSVLLAESGLDRRALAAKLAHALAGGEPRTALRLGRGILLTVIGALVLLGADPVPTIVTISTGAVLVVLGLTETVSILGGQRQDAPPGRRGVRRTWALAAGLTVVGAAAVAVTLTITSRGPPPLENEQIVACNGLAELCDRPLDQVVLPGTHNSMSAADRPGWLFANQTRPIPRQLADGIRLLMVDPHYGIVDPRGRIRTDLAAEGTTRNRVAAELGADAVGAAERLAGRLGLVPERGKREIFLCHTLCELGAEPLDTTLDELRGWLEQHRSEVVVLMLESSVEPTDVEEAFHDAHLDPHLATLPRQGALPTLRELITAGRRLIVLDEGDGGSASWLQPAFLFAQNTSIAAFTEDQRSCAPGRGTPDSPLLILNNWVDRFPPPATAAARVNRRAMLEARVARCRDRLGRVPTATAVDFYERGGLLSTVNDLNRRGVALPDGG